MENTKDKLIRKHALKRVILHLEFSSEINMELLRIGVEYTAYTEREITKEPEYIELFNTLCELIGIK